MYDKRDKYDLANPVAYLEFELDDVVRLLDALVARLIVERDLTEEEGVKQAGGGGLCKGHLHMVATAVEYKLAQCWGHVDNSCWMRLNRSASSLRTYPSIH